MKIVHPVFDGKKSWKGLATSRILWLPLWFNIGVLVWSRLIHRFLKPVRTMPASILTAIAPVKVILFSKHHQAVGIEIEKFILGRGAGHVGENKGVPNI